LKEKSAGAAAGAAAGEEAGGGHFNSAADSRETD
jgi:hypothetical protein